MTADPRSAPTEHDIRNMPSDEAMVAFQDEACVLVTNRVLTRGGLIREGWSDGKRYFETKGYPGAFNYFSIRELTKKPDWVK